eukprot:968899-Alexandrium_andersonii.AAC.1
MSGGWAGGQPRAGGSREERTPGPCWRRPGLGRRASMCSASFAGASPPTPPTGPPRRAWRRHARAPIAAAHRLGPSSPQWSWK